MQDRPLYVVPDTNVLLHGRPLESITAGMLALDRPFIWLFVRTVVKDLDDKSHHQNARIRKRAQSALRRLIDADASPNAVIPIERYRPGKPPAYDELGLDPHDLDDRIRAEIILFARDHPETDVVLFTFDYGMQAQARDHGIELIVPAVDLRAVEEEDHTERELRLARIELTERDAAQPNVNVAFESGMRDQTLFVYPELTAQMLDRIVASAASPDADTLIGKAVASVMIGWRKDPGYANRLASYAAELRELVPKLWKQLGASSRVTLILTNSGNVEAEDVSLNATLPMFVQAITDAPTQSPIPRKPSLSGFGLQSRWTLESRNRHPSTEMARPAMDSQRAPIR